MPNQSEMQRKDLDGRIIEELRQGPRTQEELSIELGEAESRIRPRLQFLNGAGYIKTNDEETDQYELQRDPKERGLFEDHPHFRIVAYGAILLLSWSLYYVVFRYALPLILEGPDVVPPIVAIVSAVPFAWITARVVIAPRILGDSPGYMLPPPQI